MAYKNNLLEYYGGGAVPYRQGYKKGGEIPRFESKKAFADYYKSEMNKLKGDYKGMSSDEYGIALYEGVDSSRVRLLDRVKEQFWKDNYERLLGETGYPESIHENKELRLENINSSKPFGAENYKQKVKDSFLRDTHGEGLSDSLNIYSEFQAGGSVGNSLLGMQYGGYTGGGALGNLGRLRSIMKATKDVQSRAKQIKSKKSKAGLFGKLLGKGAEWGTKALLGSTLGPLGLLAAKTIGSGIGGYLGAKLGYGKKVGTGLDESKWLAGDREKLGQAEGNLEDLYKDIAGKQASATAKSGGTKFLKEAGAKTWGDYAQAKFGKGKWSGKELTPFNEAAAATYAKAKEATPESILGAAEVPLSGEATMKVPALDPFAGQLGDIAQQSRGDALADFTAKLKADKGYGAVGQMPSSGGLSLPKAPSLGGGSQWQVPQFKFGAQAGQRGVFGGLSSLAQGETNFLQQQPWAQAGYQLPEQSFGEDLITGQYSPWSNITSGAYAGPSVMRQQQGGMVRDDRALIDMLYRR